LLEIKTTKEFIDENYNTQARQLLESVMHLPESLQEELKKLEVTEAIQEQQNKLEAAELKLEMMKLERDQRLLQLHELPPEFTPDMLPDEISKWMEDTTLRMGVSFSTAVPIVITMLGSLLGGKIKLALSRYSGWYELATTYGLLVGGSGKKKSPVEKAMLSPLIEITKKIEGKYQKELEEYLAEIKTHKTRVTTFNKRIAMMEKDKPMEDEQYKEIMKTLPKEPQKPIRKSILADDATPQVLIRLMEANRNGIFYYQEELSQLLAKMDKDGREGERGMLLKAYDHSSVTLDRVGDGLHLFIEKAILTIYGGIQESMIKSKIKEAMNQTKADGFMPRFQAVAVLPENKGLPLDRPINKVARKEYADMIHYFYEATHGSLDGTLTDDDGVAFYELNDEALQTFNEWNVQRENIIADSHDAIASHLTKSVRLISVIGLIIHIVRCKNKQEPDPHFLSNQTMKQAIKITDNFIKHSMFLYEIDEREKTSLEYNQDKVIAYLEKNRDKLPIGIGRVSNSIRTSNGKKLSQDDIKQMAVILATNQFRLDIRDNKIHSAKQEKC